MTAHVPKSKMRHFPDGSVDMTCWHAGNETKCFYCHEIIDEETYAIQWMGAGDDLWLHPGCVIELTMRLYLDVHQIECMSSIEPLRGWSPSERNLNWRPPARAQK